MFLVGTTKTIDCFEIHERLIALFDVEDDAVRHTPHDLDARRQIARRQSPDLLFECFEPAWPQKTLAIYGSAIYGSTHVGHVYVCLWNRGVC